MGGGGGQSSYPFLSAVGLIVVLLLKKITRLCCITVLVTYFIYSRASMTRTPIGKSTVADSNSFFESIRNSSNSSRKQIFGDILEKKSYLIMGMCVVCTH